jgi:hypothetical protein
MTLGPHRHASWQGPSVHPEFDKAKDQFTVGGRLIFVQHTAALSCTEKLRFKRQQILMAFKGKAAWQSPLGYTP